MSVEKSVLIGGGSGFVGGYLSACLRAKGYNPLILSRSPSVKGRTLSWSDLRHNGLPDKVYAIVNLTGRTIGDPKYRWTEQYKNDVWHSRIESTRLLRDTIVNSNESIRPKIFVTASAVGIYPPTRKLSNAPTYNESYDSSKACQSDDFFQRLCHAWEAAGELPHSLSVRKATVRIGIVLGRTGGIVSNIIYPFYAGFGGSLGDGQWPFPWVHVNDVAAIIEHIISNPEARGIFNAVAPVQNSYKEFVSAFAGALHRPCIMHTPEFAVRLMFGNERAKLVMSGQFVEPKLTMGSGYKFQYTDLNSACKEIARLQMTGEEKSRITSRVSVTQNM